MTQKLAVFSRKLKENFKPRRSNFSKPVSAWSEKDRLDGKQIDAFVIILKTQGCSWAKDSGCSMCGYFNDSAWEEISDEDLLNQFEIALEKYNKEKLVKIFTSGSFLDYEEISKNVRDKIFKKLLETADKISVESRPEYITKETLSQIKILFKDKQFEVGIGLETADDFIREKFVNKGFTFEDYKKSAILLRKYDFKIKTYILIKPPFISEKKSISDAIQTVKKIKDLTDIISFNPTNVQNNTVVEYLWRRNQYRPPWFFSVIEILQKAKKIAPELYIKCDVAGGGSIRGAHNCKSCDKKYLKAINNFSLTQDIKYLENQKCSCKEKWLDVLDLEDLSFNSIIDIR